MKKILCLLGVLGGIAFISDTALALRLAPPYDAQILKVQNEYKIKENSLESNFDRDEQMIKAKKDELELVIRTESTGTSMNPVSVQKNVDLYHKTKKELLALEEKYEMNLLTLKKERNTKLAVIENKWAKSLQK